MRFSYLLWLSACVVSPASAFEDNRTLPDLIHEERRYVLFNSRRLSGECLDICVDKTSAPTEAPEPPDVQTQPPTDPPTDSPTVRITDAPTKNPTASPTVRITDAPTKNPTASPTVRITDAPTKNPTASPTVNTDAECVDMKNFGVNFSEATSVDPANSPAWPADECYPHITNAPYGGWGNRDALKFDDSVAIFAGGDFIGKKGTEVEGKLVVLGDLKVKNKGPKNFVTTGGGTHIVPSTGSECIIVGGDIETDPDVQVYNLAGWMECDIVYRGKEKKIERWKTQGSTIHDPNYDMSYYEKMVDVWKAKSDHWKNLPATGTVVAEWSTVTFQCSDLDEIQVFNLSSNSDINNLSKNSYSAFEFSDECEGKSLLINVLTDDKVDVNANAMWHKDKLGFGENGFSSCLTQSILWHFPDAKKVDIGNGKTSEFHGSILYANPDGELKLDTTGHSGRLIVLGDIVHDHSGASEFHSYPYNPPIPLPDPEGLCLMDPNNPDNSR